MRILGGVRTEDGRGKGFMRFILILGIGSKGSGDEGCLSPVGRYADTVHVRLRTNAGGTLNPLSRNISVSLPVDSALIHTPTQ